MTYTQRVTVPKNLDREDVTIDLDRASVILKCNREWLRQQCVAGKFPAVKVSGKWLFYKETLEQFLKDGSMPISPQEQNKKIDRLISLIEENNQLLRTLANATDEPSNTIPMEQLREQV